MPPLRVGFGVCLWPTPFYTILNLIRALEQPSCCWPLRQKQTGLASLFILIIFFSSLFFDRVELLHKYLPLLSSPSNSLTSRQSITVTVISLHQDHWKRSALLHICLSKTSSSSALLLSFSHHFLQHSTFPWRFFCYLRLCPWFGGCFVTDQQHFAMASTITEAQAELIRYVTQPWKTAPTRKLMPLLQVTCARRYSNQAAMRDL